MHPRMTGMHKKTTTALIAIAEKKYVNQIDVAGSSIVHKFYGNYCKKAYDKFAHHLRTLMLTQSHNIFAFLVRKTSGILFFGPSFRKPARKASSGEIYLKNKDLYATRLPVTRWVKLSLNFELLVPK